MHRRCFAIALLAAVSTFMFAHDVPLANWTVPTYHASSVTGGLTTMADVTPGVGFIGIQPCRVADTRGNGAPITGGIFANSALRTWDLTGLCGLPAGTDAISANFTVVAAGGIPPGSFLLAWPTGQAPPPTAIMTYGPGQIISNAAIVPLGPGEQLNVNVSGSTHIVMDVNGYFTDQYNPGVSFHAVSSNVAPAILAENTSTVANAVAIQGVITSTNPGDFATAVRGINNGDGYGLYGSSVTGFGVVASTGGPGENSAVWARNTSDTKASSGVFGWGNASSGQVFGGKFITDSQLPGAAGVKGVSGYGDPGDIPGLAQYTSAGVLGVDNSGFFYSAGVEGISRQIAVGGLLLGSTGTAFSAYGCLGCRQGSDPDGGEGPWGVFAAGNIGATGTKPFLDPHPTDPSLMIQYTALEGPEAGTYFRGKGKFNRGVAIVSIPEDFRLVTDAEGLSVQVTPIGQMATIAVKSISLDRIVLQGSRDVEFFFTVNGVRSAFKNEAPIRRGSVFAPGSADATIPEYLSEEQKRRLIQNGTYRTDGTVNVETARRLGWDRRWKPVPKPLPTE
jgi:hypothetical protein